jgi:GntR family transcriptional regulator, transcriptional repressor for pyruvate dehydrogenase complex
MTTNIATSKKKLAEQVIEEIKQRLVDGKLFEGDKLPNQPEFARQLGVSRLTLREALNTLTQMGVIEQKPGRGTTIISGNTAFWSDKPKPPLLSDTRASLELIEARRLVETAIAPFSVKRKQAGDIDALHRNLDKMELALESEDKDGFVKGDLSFHYHLAKAAHNRYLLHIYIDMSLTIEKFMHESFVAKPDMMVIAQGFHRRIFESLQAGNADRYVREMKEHLDTIEGNILEYYRSMGLD